MINSWRRNYVYITHIPTGIKLFCDQHQSQHKNKDSVWLRLQSLLYALQLGIVPKTQVIRTYTLPEGEEYPDDITEYSREVKYDDTGRVTIKGD